MKTTLLLFLLLCSGWVTAQKATQWLSLTPIQVEKPVLAHQKDVDNKTFSEKMLLDYSFLNIRDLHPDENRPEKYFRQLSWQKASLEGDTLVASPVAEGYTLNYYAVYFNNTEWVKGKLVFNLFGNAEIYLDGTRKLVYNENKPVQKTISCELVPGKHTLLIKTVTQGGKVAAARFEAETSVTEDALSFTTSPKRGKNIYDVLNGKRILNLSLSPSGRYTIVNIRETEDGKGSSTIHVYRVDNKEIVYSFPNGNISPQWVPGKDELSFLKKEGNGNSLYVYNIDKQELRCLIKEDKEIKNYTWSPDLSYLIYYKSENYTDDKWELRKLSGIEDRQSYYRHRSWLCKFDFSTGLHSRLTWGNLSTSLMDISHDGKYLLFSTSYPDYSEFPYRKQSVYLLNVKEKKLDTLWKDRRFSIYCSFSPDDTQLLINGGPSAFGKTGENIGKNALANQYDNQLYIYTLSTKQTEPITYNFHPSVNNAYWHTDGNIYITATDADYVHLFRYDVKAGKMSPIKCPGDIILRTSIAEKGQTMMYSASNVTYPPVIYTLDLNNLQAKEWDNPSQQQYENVVFGPVKDWVYPYKKGTTIDGRYYLPADFDPNKKYPLIVYYYGGTTPVERSFASRYPFNLYAANGYVVYVLQPSGTIGYGQEFSARHQNNWGKITANEIISATKAFLREHPFIDDSRVGCMGASYGGFTTMYLTTQTNLFACAISHAGISSLDGYWGDGYWGYSYSTNATGYSFPWNRKDIYVDQSPLFNADKINTPLLLIHGTKDVNVPTAQSMQLYTALQLLNKDVELVFVKDADHHVVEYKQRILWNNTILAYFAKYLKNQPEWWKNLYPDKNLEGK